VLTGSLGLVLSTPEDTPESLLRNADVAMYAAKDSGKDGLRMFQPSMRDHLLERVALEADLRVALLAGEIVPWFQPVIDLETGRTVGVEALARWKRDDGFCPPGVFVPLAEQSGLVSQLGRQVLRSACAHAARWNRDTPLTLSVNLSAVQLASDDLVDLVRDALYDSGLAPERLVLEITETVLMEDADSVGPRLAALRSLGVRIALDDFGTGYSALGYLQKIPVDIVKIDRAFVRDVHLGARQSALAAAVMTLAGSLDLDVIAEGIELPEQAARLRSLGCRLAQGFLYSQALSPDDLLARLRLERAEWPEKSSIL
jgi:EAL domain-containing protein (putative c-di-GMP-specific phosphodiesterase class I)